MDNRKKDVPVIGQTYHFFDDGKITRMRHSMATVLRLVSPDDAKNIFVNSLRFGNVSLWDVWKDEVEQCDWLYATKTDYFVEASDRDYDENNLWFVRTLGGGWFSLDIQSGWQGGELDVDGHLYESIKDLFNK